MARDRGHTILEKDGKPLKTNWMEDLNLLIVFK